MNYAAGASVLANRYTYAAANPLAFVDPEGTWPSWSGAKKAFKRTTGALKRNVKKAGRALVRGAKSVYRSAKRNVSRIASAVSRGYRKAVRAVSRAARQVVAGVRRAWSRARVSASRVVRRVAGGARRVVHAARESARAAAVRVERARAEVRRVALATAAYVARAVPLPPAVKQASAFVARVVADPMLVRDLPAAALELSARLGDMAEAKTRELVDSWVSESEQLVRDVSAAGRAFAADPWGSTKSFVTDNPELIAMGASALVTGACLGLTAGAGSVACLALGGAAIGAVSGALDCPAGRSKTACAAVGGVVGGVSNVVPGGVGVSGAVRTRGVDAVMGGVMEYHQSGRVTAAGVVSSFAPMGGSGKRTRSSGRQVGATCSNSFTGDTRVVMADGSSKAIADVVTGDRVATVDERTGRRGGSGVVGATVRAVGVKSLVVVSVVVGAVGGPAAAATPAPDPVGPVAAATPAPDPVGPVAAVTPAPDPVGPVAAATPAPVGSAGSESVASSADGFAGSGVVESSEPAGFAPVVSGGVVVEATVDHPVLKVDGSGGVGSRVWVGAGSLVAGDRVVVSGDRVGVVTGVVLSQRREAVFNLSVTGDHTFLVTAPNAPPGADALVVHNCGNDPNAVHLYYKSIGWTPAQKRDGRRKMNALNSMSGLAKQAPDRGSVSAKSRYIKNGGNLLPTQDADHIRDLQFGGSDTVDNMWALDATVNRSMGAQFAAQLRGYPCGTRICGILEIE